MAPSDLACPLCHEKTLTPLTRLRQHHTSAVLEFAVRGEKPGFFGTKTKTYAVRRARACLSCGHVMMGLWEDDLTALKKDIDGLAADLS